MAALVVPGLVVLFLVLVLVLVAVCSVVAAVARRLFGLITVQGGSMSPTFVDGDRILIRLGSGASGKRLRPCAVVVFRNPRPRSATDPRWLVKRIAAIEGTPVPPDIRAATGHDVIPEGCFVVRGDNPVSLDSREFGYVRRGDVLGVALRS
jgi:signal peptidase I